MPGTTLHPITRRTSTPRDRRYHAASEPTTAPKWSAARWKPKARPRSSGAVTPAMSASRGGVRIPFPTRSITRNPTTCQAAPATAMSGRTSTAVA